MKIKNYVIYSKCHLFKFIYEYLRWSENSVGLKKLLGKAFWTGRIFSESISQSEVWNMAYEPRCEKTCLRGFRPGPAQTGCTATEDG